MKVAVLCALVSLLASGAFGTECHDRFGGICLTSLRSCPSGSHVSFSYCGFLQICCWSYASASAASASHPSGSSSSSSGSQGSQTGSHAGTQTASHTPAPTSTCGLSAVNSHSKIVGGTTAIAHEFPWQVSLMYNGQHLCGGTIIDSEWVLSAAHCFENTYKDLWKVALGVHDNTVVYRSNYLSVRHIYVHSNFNGNGRNNDDIALIQLEKPVDTTRQDVRAACLPHDGESFENQMCTVTGWGSSYEDGAPSRYLQKVSLPVLSNDVCNYWMGVNIVSNKMMCAGLRQGGKDACQGDSGGPLVCQKDGVWKLAGIVSWGFGCGQARAPGIYTRVSSYLNWIQTAKRSATSG